MGNPDAFPLFKMPSMGTGPKFFKEWVRTEFLHDTDFIKFHIDGGFATPHDDPRQRCLTEEEIKAIIETAHECGKKATAHIYFDESAKIAIKHGIDGIEHGCLLSEATIRLLEEKEVYLVPTMKFVDRGVYLEDLDDVPEYMAEKYRGYHDTLVKTREAVIDRLVNGNLLVGYGADLGAIDPTSKGYLEFETMVRACIPPLKALKCATSNSAKIVERDDLGVLKKGKKADLAAWAKNPVEDSRALRECAFVMKGGKVIKHNSSKE
jgi:imidazolonepropionase-like amidohydrolase